MYEDLKVKAYIVPTSAVLRTGCVHVIVCEPADWDTLMLSLGDFFLGGSSVCNFDSVAPVLLNARGESRFRLLGWPAVEENK
jgi:hypothetical protein